MPLKKALTYLDPSAGVQMVNDPAPQTEAKAAQPKVYASHAPKSDTMSKAAAHDKESYWANKEARDIDRDRRMSRAGVFQAALQSPALMQYAPNLDAYIELVARTANAGLEFVNQA